jgi:hypothetical protein
MPNTVKRLNYFDHQFLRAPDFSDEQNYHLSMRRLHNSSMHTWGIAQGLQVTPTGGGTGTAITVSSGVALDSAGRELVLASDTNLELGGIPAGTTLYITIAYDEQQSDPTTEAGGPGNTRVTEAPKLSFSKDAPSAPATTLILAKVPRTNTGLGTIDGSDRKQAGVALGNDLTINRLTLKKDGVAQANWPALSCSAANQAGFANAGLTISGSMGIGMTSGPSRAKLQVDGMVGHTVGLFGGDGTGMSLVATSPNLGFNCYYSESWKAISAGWAGNIALDQDNGAMSFYVNRARAGAADAALSPQASLQIRADGKLSHGMWRVTQVMEQEKGPLPTKSANFSSGGGTLIIIFSGSGFRQKLDKNDTGLLIGLQLKLNDKVISTTNLYANDGNVHMVLPTNIHVEDKIAAGDYKVKIDKLNSDTKTDSNDYFNVTVLEMPF